VIRWMAWAISALLKPKALLVVENLCLRQQLVVLQRRQPRPRLRGADRRFWILARQWYSQWRDALLIEQPETVLRWHREGWRAYWRWRSRPRRIGGREPISAEVRALIRRMASENRFWGQRRIQAELVRLGFKVSARTVAKYMRRPYAGKPSPAGGNFSSSMRRISGPVTSSACERSGSRRSMFSLRSVTPTARSCMSR
jgi:hypothetical protein